MSQNTQSARGLFRAMGKKAKPQPVRLLDGSYTKVDTVERNADEFYPTPVEPIHALIHRERPWLSRHAALWECAAGDGVMARELESSGFQTHRSDLVDRGCGAEVRSFYDYGPADAPSRAIVTNPPYAEINCRDGQARWGWHALKTLDIHYMALLLNWSWPGAGGLSRFWDDGPGGPWPDDHVRRQPGGARLMSLHLIHLGKGQTRIMDTGDTALVLDQPRGHQSNGDTLRRMAEERRALRDLLAEPKAKTYQPGRLLMMRADQCRFIAGQADICCGRKVRPGFSYCPEPTDRCYREPERRESQGMTGGRRP